MNGEITLVNIHTGDIVNVIHGLARPQKGDIITLQYDSTQENYIVRNTRFIVSDTKPNIIVYVSKTDST